MWSNKCNFFFFFLFIKKWGGSWVYHAIISTGLSLTQVCWKNKKGGAVLNEQMFVLFGENLETLLCTRDTDIYSTNLRTSF